MHIGLTRLTASGQSSGKQDMNHRLLTGTVSRGLTSLQTQHTLCCVESLVQRAVQMTCMQHSTSDLHKYGGGKQAAILTHTRTHTHKKLGISDLEFVKQ